MQSLLGKLLLIALLTRLGWTAEPRGLVWSSQAYGPDGPWQAVSIHLGSNNQPLDLYAGNTWHSNILASPICSDTSIDCYAQAAGLYNSLTSTSVSTYELSSTLAQIDWTSGAMPLTSNHTVQFDTATITAASSGTQGNVMVPDLSLQVILDGYYTLPNGTNYPLVVGTLALGAENINQTYPHVGTVTNFNASEISGYLYETQQIPSNSYGLHIGSAALGIPGSAFVGGYDQSRVLGQVTTQAYAIYSLPIDLLDIGIGVAEGGSPFNFSSMSGILAQGNSSIGISLPVLVEPTIPYLYLPSSTCDAIAAQLPVTFQQDYGLYFWNIDDPRYTRIVTSPAYLSFTFRLNGSNVQNMTINVPFQLLNLTLEEPLAHIPTQYFPCRPLIDGGSYTLGRAFLQAAFVGVNWQTNENGVWFLAQAPGPNTPSTAVVTSIGFSDTSIAASPNQWIDSWKGSWTVLDEQSPSGYITASSPSSSSAAANNGGSKSTGAAATRLTAGEIAGIVAGCVVLIAALALLSFFCIRRRKARTALILADVHSETKHDYPLTSAQLERVELESANTYSRVELAAGPKVLMELESTNTYCRVELAAEPKVLMESDGSR